MYSHGFQEYIEAILEKIDPDQKWFKNRDKTVLAPRDLDEQKKMLTFKKRLSDFKNEDGSYMLDPSKTLIVDD